MFWQICDRECQALQVKLFIQSVGDECQVLSVSAVGLRGTGCLYLCHNQTNFCLCTEWKCKQWSLVVCEACYGVVVFLWYMIDTQYVCLTVLKVGF